VGHAGGAGGQDRDQYHSHRHGGKWQPAGDRAHRQSRTAGREHHRVIQFESRAAPLAVELQLVPLQSLADLESAFAKIHTARPHALIVLSDNFFVLERKRIVDFTAKIRLPAVYSVSVFADVGGLMVYGVNYHALFRRAATYVDRILKGTKPADLPVEQATTFELLINLKTARVLALKIPPSLLLRADRIIE
jgi:putative ABC transport system substrate-binding protein